MIIIDHTPGPWFIHEEKHGPITTIRMIRGALPEGKRSVTYREPVANVLSNSPRAKIDTELLRAGPQLLSSLLRARYIERLQCPGCHDRTMQHTAVCVNLSEGILALPAWVLDGAPGPA